VADRACRSIEKQEFCRDDDRFAAANVEAEVAHQRAPDVERQRFDDFWSESVGRGGDLVRSRRNGGDLVSPLRIGRYDDDQLIRCIAKRDGSIAKDRSRGIEHAALQRACRLRARGDRRAEQEQNVRRNAT
jgi:hypothetical protein